MSIWILPEKDMHGLHTENDDFSNKPDREIDQPLSLYVLGIFLMYLVSTE